LGSSGIAASVTITATSDTRYATVDRAGRGEAVSAGAPARYPT
jgi:hypothetical protein